jgi:uncharacterized protein YcgI (DUF1989 family)
MGRVLAGIVADSCGWHDPFGGCSTPKRRENMAQDATRSCATASTATASITCWLMGKWDLGLEDLLMVVNFFSKVTVDEGPFSVFPPTAAPEITLSCLRRWTSSWC